METVTITVPVGGPVWAAWMLSQGKTIACEGATQQPAFYYRLAGDDVLCCRTDGSGLGRTAISLSEFLCADYRWREYKEPQEPQGWDWAFAEMQAGRVVQMARTGYLLRIRDDKFESRFESTRMWGEDKVTPGIMTGKRWLKYNES